MTRDQELARDGWVRRTTYDDPRLSEVAGLYRELGQEVHLEPFNAAEDPGCAECMKATPDRYWTVYTR